MPNSSKWIDKDNLSRFWDSIKHRFSIYEEQTTELMSNEAAFEENIKTRVEANEAAMPSLASSAANTALEAKFGEDIADNVTDWLDEHVDPVGSAVVLDDTLTISGAAADAKAAGDGINDLKADLSQLEDVIYDDSVYDWSKIGSSTYLTGFRTGYYDSTTGAAASSSTYLRSVSYVIFHCDLVIMQAPEGFSFGIYEYDGSGTYVRSLCSYGNYTNPGSGTTYFEFEPVNNCQYKFVLSGWNNINNSDITQQLVNGWVLKKRNIIVRAKAITELKSDIDEVEGFFSDGSTLLSNSLSDKTASSNGINYSLSGNTVTMSGIATANSIFALLGSTSSAPPAWLTQGKKFVVSISTNVADIAIGFQGTTSSNTSFRSFVTYTESGKYIFAVPSDITVFRLAIVFEKGTQVSGTATIEVSNAIDISVLPNIKDTYMALSASDAVTIPDNTDFNTLTTPGTYKVTNNTHAGTMSNMPYATAGKLLVIATSQATRITQIYFVVNTYPVMYIRNYTSAGWGYWGRTVYEGEVYRPLFVGLYSTGTGDTTEVFNINIPATNGGYIKYEMRHFVDETNNCDGWQIYHAYYVDQYFSNAVDLTISGEWECALRLQGRDDFSGGHTHGDEIMDSVTLLVDGVPTAMSDYSERRLGAKEVRFIQASTMYDPADNTTAIAEHGKEYVFTKDGLTINQSVKWLVEASLANCFMAMFLPSKNYIDRAVANSDFKVLTLPSSTSDPLTSIVKNNANAVDMWDTSSGFYANVSVPVYPTGLTGGDQASISDNSGKNYNKLYFKVCSGGTTTIGELWKSTTVYKLDFSE